MADQKVLVTGSSGRIGAMIARELLDHGYEVTGADLTRSRDVRTYITDTSDLGQVTSIMAGHDAVIHMAAIPSPASHPPEVVYQTNTISTFNVLQAATMLGINKVVLASSLSAFGYSWRHRHFEPLYMPLDDAHPMLSQDAYGLSKMVGEVLADGFVRRTPSMSITSLRFTLVVSVEDGKRAIEWMRSRPHDSNSFWTYVDVRDAAVASRLALEYTEPGHQAFLIAAPNSYMDEPTIDLIKQYYPEVTRFSEGFGGQQAAVDSSYAEGVLGFKAKYNWDQSLLP
ncbi:MAG: NAD(P)-dependent oxidoreductase [Anaerolineae bacterium]|nr:NAD(P)-dependent oxidoreductase [Anaerolineae bacterium]